MMMIQEQKAMTTFNAGTGSDSTVQKKKGWPKGRKRRMLPKDRSAPKGPLSGYMLFMNEQREMVKQENSKAGFPEISKIMAQKWAQLESQDRQKYLELAEADKERYHQEMDEYKKTDAYKTFLKEQQKEINNLASKKPKKDSVPTVAKPPVVTPSEVTTNGNSVLEIPIFTEEFLNHNKIREGELRQLRKSNTEYEEQNAILQKHIESMRTAVEKLEAETKQQEENNEILKQHLASLKGSLLEAFATLPVPGTNQLPTDDNIESYVSNLLTTISANPQQHSKLAQSVKSIVNSLPQ